jgi:hypothetical protein
MRHTLPKTWPRPFSTRSMDQSSPRAIGGRFEIAQSPLWSRNRAIASASLIDGAPFMYVVTPCLRNIASRRLSKLRAFPIFLANAPHGVD